MWAARTVIVSGEDNLKKDSEHLVSGKSASAESNPEGILALTPDRRFLYWTPDSSATKHGFEEKRWNVALAPPQFENGTSETSGSQENLVVTLPAVGREGTPVKIRCLFMTGEVEGMFT